MMRKVVNTPFSGSFYQLYRHQHNNQLDESDPLPMRMQQKWGKIISFDFLIVHMGRDRTDKVTTF